jgi:broad specificity phosphatase PhoE
MTNEKGLKPEPTLVLMRHAARDFSEDGLSREGKSQSARLNEILASKGLPKPALIESSPKRRTLETLRPLADAIGGTVIVNSNLDERSTNESSKNFDSRVKKFCDELDEWAMNAQRAQSQNSPVTRVACSHLDWLEAAAQFLSSDDGDLERSAPWPAMSLRIYRFENGIWRRLK